MTRPIDIYFTIGIPVALAMVLTLILFSGRMKPQTRTRVERVMAGVFYPAATVYWLWRAVEFFRQGSLSKTGAMAIVALIFIWLGFKSIRTGRLAPDLKAGG